MVGERERERVCVCVEGGREREGRNERDEDGWVGGWEALLAVSE